ncbi:MAG TPA: hypothetical protein VK921_10885 [Anditalea sp.]|nr:hypothetical protein [Anditalea sp.]
MKKTLQLFITFFAKNTAFDQRLFDLSIETKFFNCTNTVLAVHEDG